jgi:uncharacterized protein
MLPNVRRFEQANAGRPRGLDGQRLAGMLAAAADAVESAAPTLDRLNVFPVPDGDTGTNLSLTLRQAADAAIGSHGAGAREVAWDAAAAALASGMGNSGVIFSQWLAGFARALPGTGEVRGMALARALLEAAREAESAVSRPVAGTILTAMAAAASASQAPGSVSRRFGRAAKAAFVAADDSQRTLAEARNAAVPDAGALGFAVAFDAMARALADRPPRGLPHRYHRLQPTADWRDHCREDHPHFGTCMQLSLSTSEAAPRLRDRLLALGSSVLVAGEPPLVRLHVHSETPDAVLETLQEVGEISRLETNDIDADAEVFLRPVARTGVVAVAKGKGWERLFAELGADVTTAGDQRALRHAIEEARAESVIVLPNGLASLDACRQALGASRRDGLVLDLPSPPAGVAAALAFDPDEDLGANARRMRASARRVSVVSADSRGRAKAVGVSTRPGATLVTLYFGSGEREHKAAEAAARIRDLRPASSVEVVHGGQETPAYWLSFEE